MGSNEFVYFCSLDIYSANCISTEITPSILAILGLENSTAISDAPQLLPMTNKEKQIQLFSLALK